MKVNAISSLEAMTTLGKDEILKVQKKNGETSLVTMKKESLSFCQKFWSWLGCGDTSFNKVLKVIAQIQKDNEAQLKGKDFDVLKGKIKKYNPLFGSKIKKAVQAKLPSFKPPILSTSSTSSTSPTLRPSLVPPTPLAKKTSSLTSEKCGQLLDMLKKGQFTEISAELTSEEQHLEFDQIVFELFNDITGSGVRRIAFDESLVDEEKWQVLLQEKGVKAIDPWLQTGWLCFKGTVRLDMFEKQLEILEKSNASWPQKLIRLDLCLYFLYVSFWFHKQDHRLVKDPSFVVQSREEFEQEKQLVEKFIHKLKEFGESEKASTLEAVVPVLDTQRPLQLSEPQARAFECVVLRARVQAMGPQETKFFRCFYGRDIFLLLTVLVAQRTTPMRSGSSEKSLPRWVVLCDLLFRRDSLAPYKELLDASHDKELLALVAQVEKT